MSAVPSRVQVMAYLHFLLFCITVQNDYYVTVCHLITIIKIFTARKQCILTTANEVWVNKMHPVGFEPTTNALKGHCSTNWATDAGERDIALCTGDWPRYRTCTWLHSLLYTVQPLWLYLWRTGISAPGSLADIRYTTLTTFPRLWLNSSNRIRTCIGALQRFALPLSYGRTAYYVQRWTLYRQIYMPPLSQAKDFCSVPWSSIITKGFHPLPIGPYLIFTDSRLCNG